MSSNRNSHLTVPTDEIEVTQYRKGSRKLSDNEFTSIGTAQSKTKPKDEQEELELVSYAPDGGWGWIIVAASFLSNVVLDGITLSHGVMMASVTAASYSDCVRKITSLDDDNGMSSATEYDNVTMVNSSVSSTNLADSNSTSGTYNGTLEYICNPLTESTYGLVGSVLFGVTLLVGPIVSILTNKFGFRPVAVAGSLIAGLGVGLSWVVSPHTPNIWALLILYGIVTGIGFGMMFQISVVIVGLYFETKRALATGIAICGTGVGIFAMAPLVENITTTYNWQTSFILQSVMIFISAGCGLLYRPLPMRPVKKETRLRRPSVSFPIEDPAVGTVSMLQLLFSPTFLVLAFSGAIIMLGFTVPYAFLPDRSEKYIGRDNAVYLISIIGLANTFGRIGFGMLSDRPFVNTLIMSNVALTLGGVATAMSPLVNELYALIFYAVVFGLCLACFTTLRSILIMEFIGLEQFNNGFGLCLFFMGVASLPSNWLAGKLYEITGNYDVTFYVAGSLISLSGVMCYPLRYINTREKVYKSLARSSSTKKSSQENMYL